ncbi:CMGC/DYRK/YAK protein kinase [Spizellomyces punctatus DAOM BR117]|uniref:CMGC/DYRK/YAK protein kinase n=1 Tax=Spizellomyces punctatus (strain DAOM BR117) TaxID=645134 RepID=A0A0L0H8K0_SPIPD|nr:CMGC/DYRK/YAK protein kinase [Spizellomyces punctatus DAOM BR117]KNC97532.1 CMGC/DYRK/YAK protein kinase [Spizellomyces punctatus DAOM BR117]|eukprot:XP_016605572.1 CMGC/DYRK/YAK protein kinase [Spizellomyces punctatus DAOM BR117]
MDPTMTAVSPSASEFQIITIGDDHQPLSPSERPTASTPSFSELPLPATAPQHHGRLGTPYQTMPGGLSVSTLNRMTPPMAAPPPLSSTPGSSSHSELASSPGTRTSLGRRKRQSSSQIPIMVPPPANSIGALSPSSQGPPPLSPPPNQYQARQRTSAASPHNSVTSPLSASTTPRLYVNTRPPLASTEYNVNSASSRSPSSGAMTGDQPSSPSPLSNPNLQQLERKRQSYIYAKYRKQYNPSGPKADLNPDRERTFVRVRNWPEKRTTLRPSGSVPNVYRLTAHLLTTYVRINPDFCYQSNHNPRRVLTKPSKPMHNHGRDNEDWDYLLYVNDIIGSQEGRQYQIMDVLGQGTFGQVAKCVNIKTKEAVAVKVIKNKPAYHNQSLMEVAILELLNLTFDPNDAHHVVRMKDHFIHHNHLCIVFEMLSVNLYELIKQNQFRGLSTNLVRIFIRQVLDALTILNKARIIHCDLKPENILLKNLESPNIKVIDFGSACHENQTVYTYIQSRFYRSPEVLLGLPYTSSIDMWSLGCIAGELFLGLPLFPGTSEYNQIGRIVEMLGPPPAYMCEKGKSARNFFNKNFGPDGRVTYAFKTPEQYIKESGTFEQPSKRYFTGTTLEEIINQYPSVRKGASPEDLEKESQQRQCFIDFLSGLLTLNPFERWTPQQARLHPFITGERYTGPFLRSGARTTTPQLPTPRALSPSSDSEYREPAKRRPRANTISSLQETLPPQLQRLAAIHQRGSNDVKRSSGLKMEVDLSPKDMETDESLAIDEAAPADESSLYQPLSESAQRSHDVRSPKDSSATPMEVDNPRISTSPYSRSASDREFVSARQSTVSSPSTRSFTSNLTTVGEDGTTDGLRSVSVSHMASTIDDSAHTSPSQTLLQSSIETDSTPIVGISVLSSNRPISAGHDEQALDPSVGGSTMENDPALQQYEDGSGMRQVAESMADIRITPCSAKLNQGASATDKNVAETGDTLHQDRLNEKAHTHRTVQEDVDEVHGPPALTSGGGVNPGVYHTYDLLQHGGQNVARSTLGPMLSGYPLRKARSQMIDQTESDPRSPEGYSSAMALAASSAGFFPWNLLTRGSGTSQSQSVSFSDDNLSLLIGDGHPRHGETGERSALPSRRPSMYSSVEWDPFGDLERGASSATGSHQSSRRGSADVRVHGEDRSLHTNANVAGGVRLSVGDPRVTGGLGVEQVAAQIRRGSAPHGSVGGTEDRSLNQTSSFSSMPDLLQRCHSHSTSGHAGSKGSGDVARAPDVPARRTSMVAVNMGLPIMEPLEVAYGAMPGGYTATRYHDIAWGNHNGQDEGGGRVSQQVHGRAYNGSADSARDNVDPQYQRRSPGRKYSASGPHYAPAEWVQISRNNSPNPPSFVPVAATESWRQQQGMLPMHYPPAHHRQVEPLYNGAGPSLPGYSALSATTSSALNGALYEKRHSASSMAAVAAAYGDPAVVHTGRSEAIYDSLSHYPSGGYTTSNGGDLATRVGTISPRNPHDNSYRGTGTGIAEVPSTARQELESDPSAQIHPFHVANMAHHYGGNLPDDPYSTPSFDAPIPSVGYHHTRIWPRVPPTTQYSNVAWGAGVGTPEDLEQRGGTGRQESHSHLSSVVNSSPGSHLYPIPSPTGSPAGDLYRKAKSMSWGSLSTGLLGGSAKSTTTERSRHSTGLGLGAVLTGHRVANSGGSSMATSPASPASSVAALDPGGYINDGSTGERSDESWSRRRRRSEDEEV